MIACARETGLPLLTLDGGLLDAARRGGALIAELTS